MNSTGLRGAWVKLEPVDSTNRAEAEAIELSRQRSPNLGGRAWRAPTIGMFGPPMLIRDARSGQAVGLVEAGQLTGYAGVAVVLIYMDQSIARPGISIQAFALYVTYLFERGARLVHMEVLDTNSPVLRIFARNGQAPQARLRDHVYAGGRFADLMVIAFDRAEWNAICARYPTMFPGAKRGPAAVGGRRQSARG